MINKLKKSKAGFTLVELIVVIAIIGVLAAVLVPQYIQYVEKSKEGADINTLGEIKHAAEIIAAEGGATSFTITFATTGAITIDTELETIVPANSAELKSSDGKKLVGKATLTVTGGTVVWDGTDDYTDTLKAFPGLGDGVKGSEKVAEAGVVTPS